MTAHSTTNARTTAVMPSVLSHSPRKIGLASTRGPNEESTQAVHGLAKRACPTSLTLSRERRCGARRLLRLVSPDSTAQSSS